MNDQTIRRLLGLVEKTGDKVIITDPAGEHPYVLMSLDQYERLVGAPAPAAPEPPGPAPKPVSAPPAAPISRSEPPMTPQAPRPATKPQVPPWRAKLGLDAVEPSVQELFKAPVRAKVPAQAVEEGSFEAEGEEQFYLEPLE